MLLKNRLKSVLHFGILNDTKQYKIIISEFSETQQINFYLRFNKRFRGILCHSDLVAKTVFQ